MQNLVQNVIKYNVDILAIQEARWTGNGTVMCNGYKLIYGGAEQHICGTAFLIKNNYTEAIKRYEFLNDRLGYIEFKGQFNNIIFINTHAPTEDKDDDVKDEHYDTLEELYRRLPNYATKIVLGDMNAKIGKEDRYIPTIGKHSLHETTNENGQRLINFAEGNDLVIKSTMFPHKNIHKITWISPNNRIKNQIDHILINRRRQSSIEDVRTYRGADADSDHLLVMGKLKIKIASTKTTNEKKTHFNIDKLKETEELIKYHNDLDKSIEEKKLQEPNPTIENRWRMIKESIIKAATGLGNKKKVRNKWFDKECEELLKIRKDKRIIMLQRMNEETTNQYRQQRRKTKQIIRRKKRNMEKANMEQMEEDGRTNNARSFFARIREKTKPRTTNTEIIRDENNERIFEKSRIVQRWKKYFESLLNVEQDHENEEMVIYSAELEIKEPTREQVISAIKRLKNNKAPGNDNISTELLKKGSGNLTHEIIELIKGVWKEEHIPNDWKEATIVPIYKNKGEKEDCTNYRGISLLNTTYKILTILILNELDPYVQEIIDDYQTGFMKNKSTDDQIFCLRQLLEKRIEYNKSTHLLFIDFKKAFDSLHRIEIYNALLQLGIPKKLINLIKICMTNTNNQVRTPLGMTEKFETKSGVKQGDGLSPIIFNLALQYALKKIVRQEANGIGIQLLAYADDIVIFGENSREIEACLKTLEEECGKLGLEINRNKTEYMIVDRENIQHPPAIKLNNNEYSIVKQFRYLGTIITEDNSIVPEICTRIRNANKCYFALQNILKSRSLSRKSKIRTYKAIIQPILLYGSEAWPVTKETENRLQTFENKILRRIFGPIICRESGTWRIRKNAEIWQLYNEPLIKDTLKSRILRWAGHVARAPEESMISRVLHLNYDAPRRKGRPKKRWIDGVKTWYNMRKPRGTTEVWTSYAQNRLEWRNLVNGSQGPTRPVRTRR